MIAPEPFSTAMDAALLGRYREPSNQAWDRISKGAHPPVYGGDAGLAPMRPGYRARRGACGLIPLVV